MLNVLIPDGVSTLSISRDGLTPWLYVFGLLEDAVLPSCVAYSTFPVRGGSPARLSSDDFTLCVNQRDLAVTVQCRDKTLTCSRLTVGTLSALMTRR